MRRGVGARPGTESEGDRAGIALLMSRAVGMSGAEKTTTGVGAPGKEGRLTTPARAGRTPRMRRRGNAVTREVTSAFYAETGREGLSL